MCCTPDTYFYSLYNTVVYFLVFVVQLIAGVKLYLYGFLSFATKAAISNSIPPTPFKYPIPFFKYPIPETPPVTFILGSPFAHRYFLLYSPATPSLEVHEC